MKASRGKLSPAPKEKPRTILIVDDEPFVRDALRFLLEEAGYPLIEAGDGEEALKKLEENSVGVCVCDIKMAELSGLEVLFYIVTRHPEIPVIMLTGLVDVDMAVTAMKQGAFDYLTKPFRKDELLIAVQRAMSHRTVLEKQKQLEEENIAYRVNLERMVEDRTVQLEIKTRELERVNAELRKANMDSVRVLAEAIEAKDPYTKGHCKRVSLYARGIARHLNFSDSELEALEYATYLHDIGKIGISEAVLNKPGTLTVEEFSAIKEHPLIGANILRGVQFFQDILDVILYHHERFDGGGYPEGLRGAKIPLTARIAAVADAYDAMRSERPYRKALSLDQALETLRRDQRTHFDPKIVGLFIDNNVYQMAGDA